MIPFIETKSEISNIANAKSLKFGECVTMQIRKEFGNIFWWLA
jgi:hypothetical protein